MHLRIFWALPTPPRRWRCIEFPWNQHRRKGTGRIGCRPVDRNFSGFPFHSIRSAPRTKSSRRVKSVPVSVHGQLLNCLDMAKVITFLTVFIIATHVSATEVDVKSFMKVIRKVNDFTSFFFKSMFPHWTPYESHCTHDLKNMCSILILTDEPYHLVSERIFTWYFL